MAKLQFALAGKIVKKSSHAHQIGAIATKNNQDWLIPQARNVAVLLRRAGQ